jgi:nuclear pore complex protein Nup53
MDGVVEPAKKEVLSLPAPPSPVTPPPAVVAQSLVMQPSAKTQPVANGGDADGEDWVSVFGLVTMLMLDSVFDCKCAVRLVCK